MKNNNTYMEDAIPFPIKEKELRFSFIEENFDRMIEKLSGLKQNSDSIDFENEWYHEYKLIYQSYTIDNF
jgi:hypothetical protein